MLEEPTATDWAYLAGIIDGEGSLALVHRRRQIRYSGKRVQSEHLSENSYQCHITVVNTDFKMIDWIRDTFGGSVFFQRVREGRKPLYVLAWQDKETVGYILKGAMPYMLTKYEVAEAMFHFVTVPIWEKEMRLTIYDAFKNLKVEVK